MRVLVLTWQDIKNKKYSGCDIDIYKWDDAKILDLNLSDYEGIVFDVSTCREKFENRGIQTTFLQHHLKTQAIADVLGIENSFVVVIGCPNIPCGNGENLLDRIGVDVPLEEGKGKNLVVQKTDGHILQPYLQKISQYDFVVRVNVNDKAKMSKRMRNILYKNVCQAYLESRKLLLTKADHAAAFEIWSHERINSTPLFNGHIYLLQSIGDDSIELLLESLLSSRGQQEEPDWAKDIKVFGQSDIEEKIVKLKEEIEAKHTKLDEQKNELNSLREDARMLWLKGHGLEDPVKKAFVSIGCDIRDTEESGETDFCINYKDKHFAVEVKSTESEQIGKKAFRQVLEWQNKKELDNLGVKYKPLVIASNEVKKPVSERTADYLPDNLRSFCLEKGIAIISVWALFNVIQNIKAGKFTTGAFMDQIYKSDGKIEG